MACAVCVICAIASGCATLPDPKFHRFTFPKNAFIGDVQRPYVVLGPVRSKIDYQSLDPGREEKDLCKNYFNKAVRDLVKYARKQGADAVVDVKSVVFLVDGRTETYPTPECSDDGGTGQVLTQGVAVKWKGGPPGLDPAALPNGPAHGAWTTQPTVPTPIPPAAPAVAAKAAPAPESSTPAFTRSGMPVFPPGGQLVPDQDAPASAVASAPEPKEPKEPATEAEPEAAAPVTAKMEDYSPRETASRVPAAATVTAAPGAPGAAPVTAPVGAPVSSSARAQALAAPAAAAPARLPFADPRAVPGSFIRP